MFFYEQFQCLLRDVQNKLINEKILKEQSRIDEIKFSIETPTGTKFGDISTNFALVYTKYANCGSLELADKVSHLMKKNLIFEKIETKKPGFINFFLKKNFWQEQLAYFFSEPLKKQNKLKKKINVEFVSANPTGLMHIGHARGAVLGDSISSLLEECGHDVTREYYINDAGNQISLLANTILFHISGDLKKNKVTDLYPGKYLKNISNKIKDELKKIKNQNTEIISFIKKRAVELILLDIKEDLNKLGIVHDNFVSEKELSTEKKVNQIKEKLLKKDLVYFGFQEPPKGISAENWVKKKQLIFKSKKINDDSDRALIKPNGELTYFMSDIIYHVEKLKKEFDILINIWGIDHSGYVSRLKNAVDVIKNRDFDFRIKLTALVNLIKNKKSLKMSKREGVYVTLREVIKEVGKDSLRFMMISRSSDKIIDFDFDLIKQKTKENPVFYVQYAYARCCSIHQIATKEFDFNTCYKNFNFELLSMNEELNLIKLIVSYERVLFSAAMSFEPQKFTNYLFDIAKNFHNYWSLGNTQSEKRILISRNREITISRLGLVLATKKTLKKGLDLLKITAPESM